LLFLAVVLAIAGPAEAQTQRQQRQQQRSQPPPPPTPPEPEVQPPPPPAVQAAPPAAPAPPPAAARPAEQPPIAVRVVPQPKSEEELAAERQDRAERAALDTKMLMLYGLLIAIGFFLFVAFLLQAFYLGLALRAMRRAARNSERNMTVAQRAFVFVGSLSWSVEGGNVRVAPTWRNSGATPTRSLRISTNWKPWHGDLPADFVYTYARPPERLFLGPRAEAEIGTVLIPMRDVQAAVEERVHLYFWGRATYEDVFDGSEPHFIEFCYRLDVSGAAPNALSFAFALHGAHNRTDEDSQRPVALEQR
jgi:hypothetical protein